MKRNTPVAAFVEQRPGFPGYVAGLIKGREKEALLERQFSGFEIGRKLYIVLSGRDWVSPHLMRIAGKFGAEIVSERALADVLALGGHKSVIVLSRQNDLLSVGMLDRMAEKLDSEQIRHLYFKPVFGIPFDIAEIHVVRTEFLKSTGLRGLRKAKGVFYQLGLEDKRWLFGEVAGRVSPYPRIVAIEPTSLCNLKCTMCPVHSSGGKENKRAAGMMKFGLYKRIINQLPEKEKVNLVLHGYGEPLLHPEIAEMVAYAKKAGIADVQFATNGMLLTREKSAALIAAGLDRLDVSLDGFSEKEYEKIRAGAKLSTVTENIAQFLLQKGRRNKPSLNIRLVKQKQNTKSLRRFIKHWLTRADTVTVDECHEEGSLKKRSKNRFPCPALRLLMEIYWDGTVALCNMDAFGENKLGDLKREKLMDIWNGKRLNAVRKNHENLIFNDPHICGKCDWWQCFDTWKSCNSGSLLCLKNPVTAIWKKE